MCVQVISAYSLEKFSLKNTITVLEDIESIASVPSSFVPTAEASSKKKAKKQNTEEKTEVRFNQTTLH
jgi:hypothetical protein